MFLDPAQFNVHFYFPPKWKQIEVKVRLRIQAGKSGREIT